MSYLPLAASGTWAGNDGIWSTFAMLVGSGHTQIDVLVSTGLPLIYAVLDNPLSCDGVVPNNFSTQAACIAARGNAYDVQSDNATFKNVAGPSDEFQTYVLSDVEQLQPLDDLHNNQSALYGNDTIGFGYLGTNLPVLDNQFLGIYYTDQLWLGYMGLQPYPFQIQNSSPPAFLSALVQSNQIGSVSWAYQAGASYQDKYIASLIFGGYDASRFTPSQVSFNMTTDAAAFLMVSLQSIDIIVGSSTTQALNSPIKVALDSTLPYFWLPPSVCEVFENTFNLTYDATANMYFVDAEAQTILNAVSPSIKFTLGPQLTGGATQIIDLPFGAFNLTATPPLANNRQYFPLKQANESSAWQLGRAFFQEIYLIADFDAGTFTVNEVVWDISAKPQYVAINSTSGINPTPVSSPASGGGGGGGSNAGAIAGGVVGGVVAVLLIVAAIWFFRRRRRSSARAHELAADDQAAPPHYGAVHDDGIPLSQRSEVEAKQKLPGELPGVANTGRETPVYTESSPLAGASPSAEMDANVYYELPSHNAGLERYSDQTATATTTTHTVTESTTREIPTSHNALGPATPGTEGDDGFDTGPTRPGDVSPDTASGIVSPVSAAPRPGGT